VALLLAAVVGCDSTRPPAGQAVAAARCDGSATPSQVAPAGPRDASSAEIVIGTDTDTSQGRLRHRLIEEWNRNHRPKVRLVELGNSTDAVHAAAAGASQDGFPDYDLFLLDIPWIPEFAAAKLIQPLDGLGFSQADFFAAPWQAGCYQGRLYAVPFTTDVGLLYSRVGSSTPAPRSWTDLADRTAPAGGQLTMATQLNDYEGLTVNALEAIWDAGGHFVDQDAILDAKARVGLTSLVQAAVHGGVGENTFREDETLSAFRSGKATYMRNWPYAIDLLRQAVPKVSFTTRALPWRSVLGGWSLVLSAGSQHPKQAVELMRFLTTEENQTSLFTRAGLLATRPEVYADPDVLRLRPDAPQLSGAVQHADVRPATPHYAAVSAALRETVSRLVADGEDDPAVIGVALDALEVRLRDAVEGR
jgi:multiple sugar transport system substrate-binding protein